MGSASERPVICGPVVRHLCQVPYARLVCPMLFYRRGTVSVRPTLCVSIAYSRDTLAIGCRFWLFHFGARQVGLDFLLDAHHDGMQRVMGFYPVALRDDHVNLTHRPPPWRRGGGGLGVGRGLRRECRAPAQA